MIELRKFKSVIYLLLFEGKYTRLHQYNIKSRNEFPIDLEIQLVFFPFIFGHFNGFTKTYSIKSVPGMRTKGKHLVYQSLVKNQ